MAALAIAALLSRIPNGCARNTGISTPPPTPPPFEEVIERDESYKLSGEIESIKKTESDGSRGSVYTIRLKDCSVFVGNEYVYTLGSCTVVYRVPSLWALPFCPGDKIVLEGVKYTGNKKEGEWELESPY